MSFEKNRSQFYISDNSIRLLEGLISHSIDLLPKINNSLYIHKGEHDYDHSVVENIFQKKTIKLNKLFCMDNYKEKGLFDFIFGDLPFGMRGSTPSIDFLSEKIIEFSKYIQEEGIGVFLSSMFSINRNGLKNQLLKNNVFIKGVIGLPEHFFSSTSIKVVFLIISRVENKNKKQFFSELKNYDFDLLEEIFANLKQETDTKTLEKGIFDNLDDFKDFSQWRYKKQINELVSDYKEFKSYKVSELGSINLIASGKKHQDKQNSVYIPKIGNQQCVTNQVDLINKHHNYYQLVIDKNEILPSYVANFLNSEYGRLLLESEKKGSLILTISKNSLENIVINIPNIENQREIDSTLQKLKLIKNVIPKIESSLTLNPLSSSETLIQLDKISEIFGNLSEPEKIKSLIREGESKLLEFKQTLSLNIHSKQKDSNVEDSVIKTIAGFMNTEGGDLLVGVTDFGEIFGLDTEFDLFYKDTNKQKQIDKFLQHFINIFNKKIGEKFHNLINFKIIKVDNKHILHLKTDPSDDDVFVDDNVYYMRTNPATIKLEGKQMIDYINQRKAKRKEADK